MGYPCAHPIAQGQERLIHKVQHFDFACVQHWIEVAAQVQRLNLSCRVAPVHYEPAWHSQGRMTMSGHMPLVLLDIVISVLVLELQAEWNDECLKLEINNFEIGKRACGLWKQSGYKSKRVAVTANGRAEAERARAWAQLLQTNPAPTMAMSLEHLLSVEAPAEKVPEAAAVPVTPEQLGEHAAELTPNAALVEPIGGLTIYADTKPLVPSPTRRYSVNEASPPARISPRSRHKSAIH